MVPTIIVEEPHVKSCLCIFSPQSFIAFSYSLTQFVFRIKLGKSINLEDFKPLVEISKKSSVNRFIYASSSSVYGLKNEEDIHENISLEPLSDYSKYKAECEKILKKFENP